MRRRTKKLALALLLSVALLSMNMNFVYAEEMNLSDGNLLSEDQTSGTDVSTENGTVDSTGEAQQTDGNAEKVENNSTVEESTDNSAANEGGTETETGDNKEESGTGENSVTGTETGEQETSQDGSESSDNVAGDDTVAGDTAAADGTEGETPEKVYINESGEEVVPSTLVGVDYNTIADSYDGAATVLKQYVVSDTDAANTIINSYVDEDGNLVLVISQGAITTEVEEKESNPGILSSISSALGLDAEMGGSGSAPAVDGSFTGWDDIPVSYEFNWDNSQQCWADVSKYEGAYWITDPVTGEYRYYTLEEGTYDNMLRHEMQLYCDGDNVYLKITYAGIYGGVLGDDAAHANGEDFQFKIDGVETKFQITKQDDGTPITGWNPEAGTYVVDVRNGNYDPSYSIVDGAAAYYHVTENGLNNQLELKIPMEAFQVQNKKVNLDNFNKITFFTPNLMYREIEVAGSPTGAVPFSAAVFLLVPASYVWLKRKDDKEDMAFA